MAYVRTYGRRPATLARRRTYYSRRYKKRMPVRRARRVPLRRLINRQIAKKAETKIQYVLSALAVPSALIVSYAQLDEFPEGTGPDEVLGRQFDIQAINIKAHMAYQDSTAGAAVAPARMRLMIVQIYESSGITASQVPDDYLVTGPATSMYTAMWSPIRLQALQDKKYQVLYDKQFQTSTDLWNQKRNITVKINKGFRRRRTKYGAGAGNNQIWAIWWGEPNATSFTNDFVFGWQAAVTCKDY